MRPVLIPGLFPADLCRMAYLEKSDLHDGFDRIGWKTWSLRFFSDGQTQAFYYSPNVGTPTDARARILVIRGTEGDNLTDWLVDFKFLPTHGSNLIGRVHRGFFREAARLYMDLIKCEGLDALRTEKGPFYVMGHSMGGGIAAVLASMLIHTQIPVRVLTFGQPRVGDHDWARWMDNSRMPYWRTVHNNDIVCRVPPWPCARHAGHELYANAHLEIRGNRTLLSRFLDGLHGRWDAFRDKSRLDSLTDHPVERYVDICWKNPAHYPPFYAE